MSKSICLLSLTLVAILLGTSLPADWREFRGTGDAPQSVQGPSTELLLSERPIAWRTKLPGRSVASPIVVGDRVIVTASSGGKQDRLHVLSVDARAGTIQWERQYWATGRTLCHESSAIAANTPASDGKRIFAFFSSNDLVALDTAGNTLWYRGLAVDYPTAGNDVGMSSSVALTENAVIVQSEAQGDSFVIGLDKQTGKTLWRVDRRREAHWASPVTTKVGAVELVLLTDGATLTALDPATGRELWKQEKACDGISSVTVRNGTAFVPGGGLRAVRFAAAGSPEVRWSNAKLAAGAASPVLYGEQVFVINRAGVLTAAAVETGENAWQLRLKGQFWATPAIAGKNLLAVSKDGLLQAVDLSDTGKGKLLGEIKLDAEVQGSPALTADACFIRAVGELIKIGPRE